MPEGSGFRPRVFGEFLHENVWYNPRSFHKCFFGYRTFWNHRRFDIKHLHADLSISSKFLDKIFAIPNIYMQIADLALYFVASRHLSTELSTEPVDKWITACMKMFDTHGNVC